MGYKIQIKIAYVFIIFGQKPLPFIIIIIVIYSHNQDSITVYSCTRLYFSPNPASLTENDLKHPAIVEYVNENLNYYSLIYAE